jgi:hypothetical protein
MKRLKGGIEKKLILFLIRKNSANSIFYFLFSWKNKVIFRYQTLLVFFLI